MDVPPHRGVALRAEARSRQAAYRALSPADWEGYTVHYRYRETIYHIKVMQRPVQEARRGLPWTGLGKRTNGLTMVDDHVEHAVEVRMGIDACCLVDRPWNGAKTPSAPLCLTRVLRRTGSTPPPSEPSQPNTSESSAPFRRLLHPALSHYFRLRMPEK